MDMLKTAKLRAQALEEPMDHNDSPNSVTEKGIYSLLQSMRESAGLSRAELAKRLDITPPAITRLEKRPAQASMMTLTRYANACGFRLYLLYK
jgi:DNA-binding XRE family transcriptional regulator